MKAGVILNGSSNPNEWSVARIDVLHQTDLYEQAMMLAPDGHTVNFVGDRKNGASNATLDAGASGAFSGFREDFGPRARINPDAKPVSLADGRRDHNQLEESIPTAFLDENDNTVHVELVKWRYLELGPRRLLGTNAITESAQGGSVQFGAGGKGHLQISDTKIPIHKIGRLWAARIELRGGQPTSTASAASHQEEQVQSVSTLKN